MRSPFRTFLLVLGAVVFAGCECSVDVGGRDAGRRDAGTFTPRADECGNGIDDDRNGRIDDGCVCGQGDTQSCFSGDYPGHGIGACRDGVQACAVQEFGDWGMFSCVGETLPSPEVCDGIDNDCDGARDEDCPCEADTTRACSDEFATAPCMPGTQTCRAGTWSRCEGAIGPTADVCGDAIDNDCDGTVNEGCACVSTPEQCNDRIDNDCDGEVDEVTCAPIPDAGMSMPDAGMPSSCGTFAGPSCAPVSLVISEYEQQGRLALDSSGCEFAVYYTHVDVDAGTDLYIDRYDSMGTRLSSALVQHSPRGGAPTAFLTHNALGFAMLFSEAMTDPPYAMLRKVAFLDARGALVRPPITIGTSPVGASAGMFWDGTRWVAVWSDHITAEDSSLHAVLIDGATDAVTPLADLDYPGRNPVLDGAVWTGERFLVPMITTGRAAELHSFDASFRPLTVSTPGMGNVGAMALAQGSGVQLAWQDSLTHLISTVAIGADGMPSAAPTTALNMDSQASMLSIAADGPRIGFGAGFAFLGSFTMETYVRFGTTTALEPQEDLRRYGALAGTSTQSEAWVEVAPRRAVLWLDHRGIRGGWTPEVARVRGARLMLLCDP